MTCESRECYAMSPVEGQAITDYVMFAVPGARLSPV